jgi:hypothetical protein
VRLLRAEEIGRIREAPTIAPYASHVEPIWAALAEPVNKFVVSYYWIGTPERDGQMLHPRRAVWDRSYACTDRCQTSPMRVNRDVPSISTISAEYSICTPEWAKAVAPATPARNPPRGADEIIYAGSS